MYDIPSYTKDMTEAEFELWCEKAGRFQETLGMVAADLLAYKMVLDRREPKPENPCGVCYKKL